MPCVLSANWLSFPPLNSRSPASVLTERSAKYGQRCPTRRLSVVSSSPSKKNHGSILSRCSLVAVQSTAYPEAFPRQPGVSGVGDALLPVVIPSTRRAWRRRGFHPTMLVLRRARLLVPPLWHALRLTRQTADQADLSRNDRAHNRAGSMSASSRLAGRSCLIVDDILTTGSTIKEATRAIHAVGGSVLGAATIAHTPLIHNSYSQ